MTESKEPFDHPSQMILCGGRKATDSWSNAEPATFVALLMELKAQIL